MTLRPLLLMACLLAVSVVSLAPRPDAQDTAAPAEGTAVAAEETTVAADDMLWQAAAAPGETGFGVALAGVGDLDGDGVPDIGVCIPQLRTQAGTDTGALRVVSGADGHTLLRVSGRRVGEAFGSAACRVGDVDGDGVDDLVLGAPRDDELAVNAGALRLHSGRDGSALMHPPPRSVPGKPIPEPQARELLGQEPFGLLGSAIVPLPDLDGDGVADLAAAAPSDVSLSFDPGYVLVLSAQTLEPLLEIWGETREESFGAALAVVPDLDDDGLPELAVGAPTALVEQHSAGRVLIISTRTARTLLTLNGQPGERFGSAIAALPDLDDDGVGELLVGAPGASLGGRDAGAAHVVSLKTGERLLSYDSVFPGALLGSAVAALDDVDGDGKPDLALGAPGSDRGGYDAGSVLLVRSSDARLLLRIDGDAPGMRLGRSLLALGDVDGDERHDLIAGLLALPDRAAPPGALRAYAGREVVVLTEEEERAEGKPGGQRRR